jgi:L-cystine uptake protein TcyP (sodium:dicarboxylate symporter family)
MTEQSNGSLPPRTKWLLVAVAVAALIGVFASMATSLAIRDLKESQHQVIDQLKALQEGVSSNRAELKRLSDEVAVQKTPQRFFPQRYPRQHPPGRNAELDNSH